MIRRLLSAALVGVLTSSSSITAKPPDLPEDGTFTTTPILSPPAPLFRLRPTPRRTLTGSLLFGIHPLLGLLPTESFLDAPCDHPRPQLDEVMFKNMPKQCDISISVFLQEYRIEEVDWIKWLLKVSQFSDSMPTPEENEGYLSENNTNAEFAFQAVQDMPRSVDTLGVVHFSSGYDAPVHFNFGDEVTDNSKPNASESVSPAPAIEILPMPREETGVTCPYLRQQKIAHHADPNAYPELDRDVLTNLERLKDADNLVELAKELARYGFFTEAMTCCDLAAMRCPGSSCAERAVNTLNELAHDIFPTAIDTEERSEPEASGSASPAGKSDVEEMVCELMKSCHLLMSQGMQHQTAELARQAFALDPQGVLADPLVYKMLLSAESSAPPAGSSEASEPPTCPYCPRIGEPIHEIVPAKKTKKVPTTFLVPVLPPIDYEVVPALDPLLTQSAGSEEASEKSKTEDTRKENETILGDAQASSLEVLFNTEGELRLSGECTLGESVYHLRYEHGSVSLWKTTDASKSKP